MAGPVSRPATPAQQGSTQPAPKRSAPPAKMDKQKLTPGILDQRVKEDLSAIRKTNGTSPRWITSDKKLFADVEAAIAIRSPKMSFEAAGRRVADLDPGLSVVVNNAVLDLEAKALLSNPHRQNGSSRDPFDELNNLDRVLHFHEDGNLKAAVRKRPEYIQLVKRASSYGAKQWFNGDQHHDLSALRRIDSALLDRDILNDLLDALTQTLKIHGHDEIVNTIATYKCAISPGCGRD